jgi:flavin-dependent dehydrogenase
MPDIGTPDIEAFAPRYDAVIVGARCAGAATAMLLARAGAKVLVVDRQAYGSDTASTHALMRGGVLQLARWGLLPRLMAAGTPPVRQATFHYADEAVRIGIKAEHGIDALCAPRRTVLDRLLVDAAREAGAEIRHGVSLAALEYDGHGRVVGVTLKDASGNAVAVRCGLVIGADGRQSSVARLAGAQTYVEGRGASGYVYGYYAGLPDDGYHWYFADAVAAGVIPTNGGQHCVFAGVRRDAFAATFRRDLEGGLLRTAQANTAALRDQLAAATLVGRLRGFVAAPGYFRQAHGPGWALVGDAGYFKDPLTAHGITDAFRDAELLARAARDGRAQAFARYQYERDTLSRPLFDLTNTIASFDWDLDEVAALHGRLSAAMKAETDHIAGPTTPSALAA